jgi:hypothetical protein
VDIGYSFFENNIGYSHLGGILVLNKTQVATRVDIPVYWLQLNLNTGCVFPNEK